MISEGMGSKQLLSKLHLMKGKTMKEKRGLFKVSILVLVVLGFGWALTPSAEAANTVYSIAMNPTSPGGLQLNNYLNISFKYTTDEFAGVRISARPYTDGSLTPNYAASGVLISPWPSGNGSQSFTITTGSDVLVDQVRFQMYTSDWGTLLLEFFVNVEYHFGNSVYNVILNPPSPELLSVGQNVTVSFDYVTQEAGGVRIYARPLTNGSLTPGYSASGSPLYPFGAGSGNGTFRINNDNERVDQVRIQMKKASDLSVILFEVFVDVDYHVCDTSCIWYVDRDAGGDNNGFSWTDAFNSLQDALTVAWPGEQIWVADGAYRPDLIGGVTSNDRNASFSLKDGVEVYGGFDGTESLLEERNWTANETILTGNIGGAGPSDNSYHVVHSSGNDGTAILDGFTITAGNADGLYPEDFGAGMYIWTGSPTVSNCKFIGNIAANGGGMCALQPGIPSFFNCIFLANQASGSGGGANLQNSSPVFRSCMFLGNTATTGGGVLTRNNLTTAPTYTNCVFSGNIATGNGGAIHHGGPNPSHVNTELINCSLNENTSGGNAGGIYNWSGDDVSVNSCILWNHSDSGGTDESAQYTDSSGTPDIRYSCLLGWTGGYGGVGNIGTNPLFVDPDGLDDSLGNEDDNLRLQLLSPCINTGDPNPAMNDTDGSRNDMGAYGGPGAEVGGIGVIPGSGFLFTSVGNIPRSELTLTNVDPDRIQGCANVINLGLGIPTYVNSAFRGNLWLYGLFGADDTWVTHYQVLIDGVPVNKRLNKVHNTWNPITLEWEYEVVKIGPHDFGPVEDAYIHTASGFWSHLDLKVILPTSQYPDGLYHITIKAYQEIMPGFLFDRTGDLGPIGDLYLRIENSNVNVEIHNLKYDPSNPYYVPGDDGEIEECSIINLGSSDENIRFTITANHPDGYLRLWKLDCIYGKNNNGGIIAQDFYPGTPPPLWTGVTNQEFQSMNAPNPPGNLLPWTRCAYQFRLRAWRNTTNGFGYPSHREFSDHYFLDLPGTIGCSIYDRDKNGLINLVDYMYFSQHWLESCIEE